MKISALEPAHKDEGHAGRGRFALDKLYHGDLNARSKGEMLSIMTLVKGSAGYVAVEVVEGELCGRRGSFALQHWGVMGGGKERLVLEVVPDSGVGELAGLGGSMMILREDGGHVYGFDFSLKDE